MTVLSWNVVLRYVVLLLAVMDYNTRLKVGIMGTKSSQNVRVQEGLLKKGLKGNIQTLRLQD